MKHLLKFIAIVIIIISLLGCLVAILISNVQAEEDEVCRNLLSDSLRDEIASYRNIFNDICEKTTTGSSRGSTFHELSLFIDAFGNRIAGSENLENAIDYLIEKLKTENLENVHAEPVLLQSWVRGKESATLLFPRRQNLPILGLGNSIGTSPDGITAEVLTVQSFDELESRSSEAKGRIVLFAPEYISYGKTVVYRSKAASEASKHGAVAALIRSITPFSILSPHTGMQSYEANVTKIPVAALAVEDAHLIQRIQGRGQRVVVNLKMEAHFGDIKTSRNTIAEIRGSEHPEKVVIISGHLDSWDVGQGAMDDGGGAFISWNALVILKALNLRPRRTIRTILWTAEEFGYVGAKQYYKDHKNETNNWNFIMESDEGTFNPIGLNYVSGDKGSCILKEVVKLFAPLNATSSTKSDSVGSDINLWLDEGIPGAALLQQNEKYFWFHHSQGDTMDVEDPSSLDKNAALWAATAYIIADLKEDFPRD
ncbi:carboxypeptidase Q-like isoform X1 [Coccinella septempunctata]|uniref:carboxypeptidase Q-like isoform X1 n=1 Tax=Coccinella septempunctata TaxID=41139 RepID=UPI001D06B248|nr:carboxypeptidase Q-like isoform X1 [Coccinella septempunctata]